MPADQSGVLSWQYIPNGSIFLAGPFIYVMKKESTSFFCLHRLIKKMEGRINLIVLFYAKVFVNRGRIFKRERGAKRFNIYDVLSAFATGTILLF